MYGIQYVLYYTLSYRKTIHRSFLVSALGEWLALALSPAGGERDQPFSPPAEASPGASL